MSLQALFDKAESPAPANSEGKWRLVRVCPDPVAGEWFNVGVIYRTIQGKTETKFIEDASPFKCLYSQRAATNILKLIQNVQETVLTARAPKLGPQVKLGPEQYASGASAPEVLDQMFSTFVTIYREPDLKSEPAPTDGMSNSELRKAVFQQAISEDEALFRRAFHRDPVPIYDHDRKEDRQFDIPVYSQPTLERKKVRFAGLASAALKTRLHREHNLDKVALMLLNAHHLLQRKGHAEGRFFILGPEEGAAGFTRDVMEKVDLDIDSAADPFRRTTGLDVETFQSPSELAKAVIDYAR